MSANTKIEWCDATVNFWAGCTKVSPACDHCYAERLAGRFWDVTWGASEPRKHFEGATDTLGRLDRKAARLGRKLTVFINSLSDTFDNAVPDHVRADLFGALSEFTNLTFLILTKRIGNVARFLSGYPEAAVMFTTGHAWLGITICNQEEADRDIPKLLRAPAAKRFLSIEPMLGPIRLYDDWLWGVGWQKPGPLDWIIVGGESGPQARPMHQDWVRSLRDQCTATGVPFFMKQWGDWFSVSEMSGSGSHHTFADGATVRRIGKKAAGRLLDGREWNEVPA